MLDLLCRLMRAERKDIVARDGARDSFEEMMNVCTSSLEREWLEFLRAGGYHLPDRAQPYLPIYGTRPDFAYSHSQTFIYIDGPVHQEEVRETNDAENDQRLQDAGYTVVRFPPHRSGWIGIVQEYAWVFGHGEERTAE